MHPYLRRLTPLRFLAALLVVLFHFGQLIPPFDSVWFHPVVAQGHIAVSFFYCLSGFVMATVYQTPMTRSEKADYWIARFARIYPVYLLCLVLSAVWINDPTPTQVALSALLLQSWVPGYPLSINVPGWSLSVEVLFYVVFPFMLGTLTRKRLPVTTVVAAVLWVVTQFLSFYLLRFHYDGFPSASHDFIFYFPMMHLNEFVLGAVAGAAFRLYPNGIVPAGCVAIGAAAAVGGVQSGASLLGLDPMAANGLYAPLFLAAIWIIASLPRGVVLDHRFAVIPGEASYAVYLLQVPVMVWLVKYERGGPVSEAAHFYLNVAVLVALSLLIYFVFERPMRTAIKKLAGSAQWRFARDSSAVPVPYSKPHRP